MLVYANPQKAESHMVPNEQDDNSPYPRSGYAWYVVVLLTVAYVLSFIDRQILALLVEPIKASLGFSDTQMGLLLGLAFAVFYVVLGIPVGWLADRYSRRAIIGIGITMWCFGYGRLWPCTELSAVVPGSSRSWRWRSDSHTRSLLAN